MDKPIVAHTSDAGKTLNEASDVEQIEFDLLDVLSKLNSVKERISTLGVQARGPLALKLADAQGSLLYAIRETQDAVSHYSLAEELLIVEAASDVMAFGAEWDATCTRAALAVEA